MLKEQILRILMNRILNIIEESEYMPKKTIRVRAKIESQNFPKQQKSEQLSQLLRNSISNFQKIHELQDKLLKTSKRFSTLIAEAGSNDYICELQVYDTIYKGTLSTVQKARHKQEGKNYAIKKLSSCLLKNSKQLLLAKNIRSNFVVDVKDVFQSSQHEKKTGTILMKLYESDLGRVLQGKPLLDNLTVKTMIYQMVRAMHYLHMKGVSHRDICPSNFMVDSKGRLFLGDFGSAKYKNSQESVFQVGERPYRAPELHLGWDHCSKAVDVWALGCIALELLTKKAIFDGSGTIDCLLSIGRYMGTQELKKITKDSQLARLMPSLERKGLKSLLKHCEPECADLLQKMLTVDPYKRIVSIDILAHSYFDELRDEHVFEEIMSRLDISDFFDFSRVELRNHQQYLSKIIPFWRREREQKRITLATTTFNAI